MWVYADIPWEDIIDPVSLWDWKSNLIGFDINGTTFSGHPTWTTLGNTLRSIAYGMNIFYDLGYSINDYWMVAAGDDLVLWIWRADQAAIAQVISTLFSVDCNNPAPHGLG